MATYVVCKPRWKLKIDCVRLLVLAIFKRVIILRKSNEADDFICFDDEETAADGAKAKDDFTCSMNALRFCEL